MSEECNGYTNWETWNVSLWLSNDEGLYYQFEELIMSPFEYAHQRDDAVEDYVRELLDEGIITDHISLHRVNWEQVIQGHTEKADEYLKMVGHFNG